ncbi:hypothetical protein QT971_31100 [Microcoleus sp. herbarium19]
MGGCLVSIALSTFSIFVGIDRTNLPIARSEKSWVLIRSPGVDERKS